ncbi:hypothetical protein Tco_0417637 [Tanacetum coccineum]
MVEPRNKTTPATIRARTYADLINEEKIHKSVDIKATNVVLQAQASKEILTPATFQTDDLDAFDSDCDDVPTTKAILMDNLSFYNSDVFLRGEDEFHDDNPPPPPPVTPTQQAPHTLSTIKLPILKKEGLHKGYDRFQSLLSQLEIHGAGVSTKISNQKFLSTNDVSTAYGVSTSSGHNSQKEGSSSYTDELKRDGTFEMASAMISMRLTKIYKKTRENAEFFAKGNHLAFGQDQVLIGLVIATGLARELCIESLQQFQAQHLRCPISYEKEVLESVFDSRLSDVEYSPVYDRFAKFEGMHAVPPPMTGNYMPLKYDFGIDESNLHIETLESVPEPVVVEPKVVSQAKVWFDAPIIEEYKSDSDDEYVIKPSKEKEKPINTAKQNPFSQAEDSSRPARSILTLKPLPTIDPKDKGKSVLEEPEPAKKTTRSDFDAAQIARDAEIARQLQVDLQAEKERERQMEEEESKAAIARTYDEGQIRSRPPTESQLRNLMMTYLKNMGGYKHSQLKAKTFAEIQVKDSKEADGVHKQKVLEEPNSTKVEDKQEGHEESIRKRLGSRLKIKATKKSKRKKTDADLEEEEQLKAFLKIVPDEEGIIDYEVLEKRFPIINRESKFYDFDRHGTECIYYIIFRSDGSSRWIKTLSKMVTRFDRLDLVELYNLVMKRFETTTPEGIDLVLWGDLRKMFDTNAEDELWQNQERWNLKSWDLYENCGVYTLILEDDTEIHMLAERKYPLIKETLKRMLSLRLVARTASEDAYTLLKFIQKQIDEYGSYDGALAIPEQTATGKEISNPFMAGSLPKTTKPT